MSKSALYAVGALLSLLVLSGCATLSREECLRGDWYAIGVTDGQQGQQFNRIDEHRRACSGTAAVDEDAYRAGRDAGLASYCTPISGYQVASNDNTYANVCPVSSAPQFLQGYTLGQQVAQARRQVRDAEQRVSDIRNEISSYELNRDEAEDILTESDDRDARRSARLALGIIRNEISRLERDIGPAQAQVSEANQNLAFVQENTFAQLQSLTN